LGQQRIVCGKFDNNIDLSALQTINAKERVRIGSTNPNTLKPRKLVPIATNGEMILHRDGLFQVRDFLSKHSREDLRNLVVLTVKERNLILKELVDFDLRISVFEINYPIFRHIKYLSNLQKNYDELARLIETVKAMGFKGRTLAEHFSTEHSFRVERALRVKNKLDSIFAFAYVNGQ